MSYYTCVLELGSHFLKRSKVVSLYCYVHTDENSRGVAALQTLSESWRPKGQAQNPLVTCMKNIWQVLGGCGHKFVICVSLIPWHAQKTEERLVHTVCACVSPRCGESGLFSDSFRVM